MKRHTFMSDGYYAISGEENFDDQNENYCGAAIDRLAEYENLEEQERLLILPCKAGDTVWIKGDRFPAEIERISITENGINFEYVEYEKGFEIIEVWDEGVFDVEDIGKTVFLTYEEAETALNNT